MKGQSGLEFLTGVSILLLIYIVIIGAYKNTLQENIVDDEGAKQLCYTVSSGVDSSNIGGDGFSIKIKLPNKINDKYNYNITILNSSLISVSWGKKLFACSIVNQNISQKVLHTGGKIAFNNIKGFIYVTSIETEKNYYFVGEKVNFEGDYFNGTIRIEVLNSSGGMIDGFPIEENSIDGKINGSFTPLEKGLYTIRAFDINKDYFVSEAPVNVI